MSLGFPIWFIGFCVLAGIVYAFALYWRDNRFHEASTRLNRILAFLRFLAIALITFLLLSPVIKTRVVDVKKPVVVIAQDNSESIRVSFSRDDSAKYVQNLEDLRKSLKDDYDVKTVSFGSRISEGLNYKFDEKVSNLSSGLDYIYDMYANQNLGAVILATDGIYNEGSNPTFAGARLNVPLHAIALGDTTPRKDLYIKNVYNNRIAYLGDKFTLEADIAAWNCAGASTKMTLSKIEANNTVRVLQEVNLNLDRKDFFNTQKVLIDATEPGVQRYRLNLTGVSGEVSQANNTRDLFIEVLDARQKILILANAPHPDQSTFISVINGNKNYQCEIQFIDAFKGGIANYDFVILHQVPGTQGTGDAIFAELKAKRIPHLFVLGAQTNINTFNAVQSVIALKGNIAQTSEVTAAPGKVFNLFTLDDKSLPEITKFPPLISPFGDYKLGGANASVLLNQRIGAVETAYPLWVFGEEQGVKTGIITGEGIWKWRLFNYLQRQNWDIADELISKTINYLSLKEDKRRFRVYTAKNVFNENEPISFDAELYNVSYELINTSDAFINVTDADGKQYKFTFNKTEKAYTLNAGYLPVGNYTYDAQTSFNGENFKVEGKFSIQPVQLELYQTTANHAILNTMAGKLNGKVVSPDQIAELKNYLLNEKKMPALRYASTKTRSIINLKWLFFVILGLLTAEWFLRRYYGSY